MHRTHHRVAGARRAGGFTLLEIMVAFTVIAILAVIAVPQYLGAREKALRSACNDIHHTLDSELVVEGNYWTEHPGEQPKLQDGTALPLGIPASVIASARVAFRHNEPSPVKPIDLTCDAGTNIFPNFNPACAYNFHPNPLLLERCMVVLVPRYFAAPLGSDTDEVIVFHKDYDENVTRYHISMDK